MCEGCLEFVWRVSGRCLNDVWKVFGKCLGDVVRVWHVGSVWNKSGMKVSRRFLECNRSLHRKCLEVFFKSGQVKLVQVKSGQVNLGKVKL